jgi:hypothetical protein
MHTHVCSTRSFGVLHRKEVNRTRAHGGVVGEGGGIDVDVADGGGSVDGAPLAEGPSAGPDGRHGRVGDEAARKAR